MEGAYARKINSDGTRTYYRTRADYEAGRLTASRTRARQKQRINRSVGGRVV